MPRSKRRGRAQRASAALRDATARPLASVEAPGVGAERLVGQPEPIEQPLGLTVVGGP